MDILYFVIGFVVCLIINLIFYRAKLSGYLRIDTSNPDKDYYLIDISKDLNKLNKKKSIILKVDSKYRKPQ